MRLQYRDSKVIVKSYSKESMEAASLTEEGMYLLFDILRFETMEISEWTRIFHNKSKDLKEKDCWHLEFDDDIVPNRPCRFWKETIRNSGAWFNCSNCGRRWPSNKVMVVFHMKLRNGTGTIKVRPFRQKCKTCTEGQMEKPTISHENINILLENLVERMNVKWYNQPAPKRDRNFRDFAVQKPHEPSHCEACMRGICKKK